MQKKLSLTEIIIFVCFICAFSLFFLAPKTALAEKTYDPNICKKPFTDKSEETKNGDEWCIAEGWLCADENCRNRTYDFCDNGIHYHFDCGCILGCVCDPASAWSETCPGGCESWECGDDGCEEGGECKISVDEGGDTGTGAGTGTGADECECKASPQKGGLVPCGRQSDDPDTPLNECCPCTLCHFFVLIKKIIDFLTIDIAFPLLALMITAGGIMYLTSGGDPKRLNTAKTILKNAAIGVLIILCAWVIVDTLITFLTPANSPFQNWSTIQCPTSQ